MALELFNKNGIDQITVRHIAKEMGISHGNLCYHFPNIDDIILKLYENLVEELNNEISKLPVKEIDLWMVYYSSHATFSLLYKYKFLMLDFVGIMRRIEPIRTHYRALVAKRRVEFGMVVQYMIQGEYLKPEVIEGQYSAITEVHFILGDFWVSRSEIMFDGSDKEKIKYYLALIFAPMLASLTEKGLAQYKEISKKFR